MMLHLTRHNPTPNNYDFHSCMTSEQATIVTTAGEMEKRTLDFLESCFGDFLSHISFRIDQRIPSKIIIWKAQ